MLQFYRVSVTVARTPVWLWVSRQASRCPGTPHTFWVKHIGYITYMWYGEKSSQNWHQNCTCSRSVLNLYGTLPEHVHRGVPRISKQKFLTVTWWKIKTTPLTLWNSAHIGMHGSNQVPSLLVLIYAWKCGRSMEGESLEDIDHVLDNDDILWTWFWISGWCRQRILAFILDRGMHGCVGDPNH